MKKNLMIITIIAVVIFSTILFYYFQDFQDEVIYLNKKEFSRGEQVTFSIKANIELCTNDLPYSIVDENGNVMKIGHSCIGLVGSGRDCYCRNGTIDCASIGPGCSDAIACGKEKVDDTFTWNQTKYVEISEECEGKHILREEARQVKPGIYKIVVGDSEKSFLIK